MEAKLMATDKATKHNVEALRELVAQHHWAFMRTATGILRSREDAEDAVQNAYYNALRTIHNFRQEAQMKTWMIRIVINCSLVEIRKRRASRQVDFEVARDLFASFESGPATPEALYSQSEMRNAHANAVSQLPRILHEVYVPCAVLGATVAEASQKLGLTDSAGKTRLHRARRLVQENLVFVLKRRAA